MATSSIFNDIKIKNRKLARGFVDALEKAENFKGKEVVIEKGYSELRGSSIKRMLKGEDE